MAERLTVVKVGGSLYDLPDLADRLRGWLETVPAALLVPGGGPTADVVRDLDRVHQLGDEAAHWLAIRALSLNAHVLAQLLPAAVFWEPEAPARATVALAGASGSQGKVDLRIVDPFPFFWQDDERADHLPHHWQVTSDSLAVRVAAVTGARELVLLKSVAWDGPWPAAAQAGVVDAYFPTAVGQVQHPLGVRVVNLRTWAPGPMFPAERG